ncbi:MAG TPA: hypothetical protein VLD65_02170, partial [Anaerolineales bacterium]|nr:hypothetical protein [Anaerolineales bacterium]
MKPDRRGSWYLLTGVIMGVALGLLYSWLISPVKYIDAPPYALRADYKDEYRALIASAYLYNYDLLRAQDRLAQLNDENPVHVLALQAQQALSEGHPAEEVQALNTLSLALGRVVTPEITDRAPVQGSTAIPSASELSPTPLMDDPLAGQALASPANPIAGNAPVPITTSTLPLTGTATPNPTPGGPFILQETRLVCDIGQSSPLIQVDLRGATGQPVPAVEVIVAWEGGEDHFFTGLQPELGLGYGDFIMTPATIYSIRPSGGGQAVNELSAAECVAIDGSTYWGSWYLIFAQ